MANKYEEYYIWIKDYNLTYVYIPKIACTSWKLYLWQLEGNKIDERVNYKTVHNPEIVKLEYLNRSVGEQKQLWEEKVKSGEIEILSVIREPKARLISAYINKFEKHKNKDSVFTQSIKPLIQAHSGISEDVMPSFKNFVEWIVDSDDIETNNGHWLPYSKILENHSKRVRLFKLENNKKAVKYIESMTGRQIDFPKIDRLGPRVNNQSEDLLEEYYDKELVSLVDNYYRNDFKLYKSAV